MIWPNHHLSLSRIRVVLRVPARSAWRSCQFLLDPNVPFVQCSNSSGSNLWKEPQAKFTRELANNEEQTQDLNGKSS